MGNKEISKPNNFSVLTLTTEVNKEYGHWANNLTMYIQKDGIELVLNSKEIQELVKSLPRTIGGSY